MKVAVLQQFLRSLVGPLGASGASAKVLGDLERTCAELEGFRERAVDELADFLRRAKTYEEQGNWPATSAGRSKKTAIAGTDLDDLARMLKAAAGSADGTSALTAVKSLTVPRLRELLKLLDIAGSFKTKQQGIDKVRAYLEAPNTQTGTGPGKLANIIEVLMALRSRGDAPDAAFDQIEAELATLEAQLDAGEAIAAAKALGVVRSVTNRADAISAIRRKVLEVKLARESIAY